MSDTVNQNSTHSDLYTHSLNLLVSHITYYVYDGGAKESFNEARLKPVTDELQKCEQFELNISPKVDIYHYPDFYNNLVCYFNITQHHFQLEVHAQSSIITYADTRGSIPNNTRLKLQDRIIQEYFFDFFHASKFVPMNLELWRESVNALPQATHDIWQDSITIGKFIYNNYKYIPQSTTVKTTASDVLVTKNGVCQDFTHLMLALCRSQGIPSRYVSGYFFNPEKLEGEIEASHAWLEVFIPGYGWKGYDPTHFREVDTRYIKIATGRDYNDIRPIQGTFQGTGTRNMNVIVSVKLKLAEDESK